MSMHKADYINLGKTILANVIENPTVLQSIPQTQQTQATAVVGLLYSLFHIFEKTSATPQSVAQPTVDAPTEQN